MFSSRSFMVPRLTFKSLCHFEFIFMHGVRVCSSFTDLHAAVSFPTTTCWRDWLFRHSSTVIWAASAKYTIAQSKARSFNSLSEARDWTCILMDTSHILNPLSHNGNSEDFFIFDVFGGKGECHVLLLCHLIPDLILFFRVLLSIYHWSIYTDTSCLLIFKF